MTHKLMGLLACILMAGTCSTTSAQILFSADFEDGSTGGLVMGNTMLTNVTDPIQGDLAVAVDVSAANFVNLNTGILGIPANTLSLNVSIDYLFPSDTTGTAGDNIFLQLQYFDAAGGAVGVPSNNGFITFDPNNANFVADTWRTLNFNGNSQPVPTGAYQFRALLISGNGGAGAGTAYFVDNFLVTAKPAPVPEPASAMLLAMAGLGLIRRRR